MRGHRHGAVVALEFWQDLVGACGRLAGSVALQDRQRLQRHLDPLARDVRDDGADMRRDGDESLRFQAEQGLTHGDGAGTDLAGEAVDDDALAG